MWRKPEHEKSVDSSPSADSEAHRPATAPPTQASVATPTMNQHIKIKGEISGQGDFLLDGELEGKVFIPNGTFTVGPHARVAAEIEARQIVIRGEVVGSLKAHERIQIMSTAKITGDMDSRGISIEDGAELHSKVATPRIAASTPPARKIPSPEVPKATDDAPVQAILADLPQRAKGAAAAASVGPAEPEKS